MAMLLRCEAVYYDAATTMSEAVRTMMRMDAEAAQETAAQADAGFLWDFWYPAAQSTEIRGQKLVTAMLLEVPLVLGSTGGFSFRMGGWMRKWWSAAITDGGSMLAAGSASRFHPCPARTS